MPLRRRPAVAPRRTAGDLLALATPTRLAAGRTAAGVVMVARPRLMPEVLGVDSASAAKTAWVVQMLGAREVALGLGALHGVRTGTSRAWVAAGLLSDAVDVVAVAAAVAKGRLSKPLGGTVVLTALGAALAGASALQSDSSDT